MEKLTKSLSLFKERNCSVSIVLDSRTRRKNACEFPLSIRFTIDRKFFYFTVGTIMGEGTGINSWTCKDAISDLDFVPDDRVLGEEIEYVLPAENEYQKVMREGSKSVLNHSITLHTERTKEIISMVPDGGNYKDLPENLQNTRKVHIAWTRMNSNKP